MNTPPDGDAAGTFRPRPRRAGTGVAARWSRSIAAAGWCPVPFVLLANLDALELSPSEALLLVQIASFRWDSRLPFPTTSELARRMRMTPRGITKLLKGLEERGFISRQRHGRRREFDMSGLQAKLEKFAAERMVRRHNQE
jgi:hypothetical protein